MLVDIKYSDVEAVGGSLAEVKTDEIDLHETPYRVTTPVLMTLWL
jgi:hypothetical protein